jgi:phosphate transport system ATP-binding protein
MKIRTENLNLYYGDFQALRDINVTIKANAITAIIGPSGCGKSTLLRTFNRMNELIDGVKVSGKVFFDGLDIFTAGIEPTDLRKKIGMVFQRPNAFPLSILDNITYGPRVHRLKNRRDLELLVERSLDAVHLRDELKDRLSRPALELTLEQQQRLCIARLLAVEPEVLLMDEPCSALDPIATLRIEELMYELKKNYTIVIVTHNMQQAARVSDETGFMLLGDLVEFGATEQIFTRPRDPRTDSYIAGKFG